MLQCEHCCSGVRSCLVNASIAMAGRASFSRRPAVTMGANSSVKRKLTIKEKEERKRKETKRRPQPRAVDDDDETLVSHDRSSATLE